MQLPFERKNIYFLLYLLIIPALLFSKALLSICSVLLVVFAIFTFDKNQKSYLGINPILRNVQILRKKSIPFIGMFLFLIWMILSGVWSQDLSMYAREVNSKLFLLIIPLQFILGPKLSNQEIKELHYFFYAILSICCILVTVIYLMDYVTINDSLKRGKSVPTPIDHIRFSMMLAYGCLSIIAFFIKKIIQTKGERIVLLGISLFFFTMLHILAVRTGLALFYIGFIFLITYMILRQKRYLQGGLLLGLLFITPIFAYFSIPTIQNKVKYTLLDYSIWSTNEEVKDSYSDNDRMLSMKVGMQVWSNDFIFGTGGGDYRALIMKEYEENHPARRKLLPHNQYIRTGLGFGIIGVVLLLSMLLLPLRNRKHRKNILLLLFILIYGVSFFVESNLERFYSLAFFLFFYGWILMLDSQNKT